MEVDEDFVGGVEVAEAVAAIEPPPDAQMSVVTGEEIIFSEFQNENLQVESLQSELLPSEPLQSELLPSEPLRSELLPSEPLQSEPLQNETVISDDLKCNESTILILSEEPVTSDVSIVSSQPSLVSPVRTIVSGETPPVTVKRVAIAPKPVGTINKNLVNSVKRISLSNIRPKMPTLSDARPHLVVVPTTGGKIRLIGSNSMPQIGASQLIRTAGNQVIQLRQSTPPALTKFAIVQGGDVTDMQNVQKAAAPRYLSLQQAQQMGIVSGGKITQLVTVSPLKQVTSQTSSVVRPQIRPTITTAVKQPTKILPAPPKGGNTKIFMTTVAQNVNLKTVTTPVKAVTAPVKTVMAPVKTVTAPVMAKPATLKPSQIKVETVSGSGNTIIASLSPRSKIDPNQIHQLNIPGKGMQFVRLVATSHPTTSVNPMGQMNSPVRIAPMTMVRAQATNKVTQVQAKPPHVITKPVMFDSQGNVLELSADGKTMVPSTDNTIDIKKLVVSFPSKFKTLPLNVPIAPQNISQAAEITPVTSSSAIQIEPIKTDVEISETKSNSLIINKIEPVKEASDNKLINVPSTSEASPKMSTSKSSDRSHLIVVQNPYMQQMQGQNALSNIEIRQEMDNKSIECSLDLGMRPRKPCNCTKSQCLKLYCDCFANGEFCNGCNCANCYNNLSNENFRQKAIRTCLERNPNAFRPKIGKAKNYGLEVIRRHNKGCNCKRSGCLKNYCECYEGKIACSANCKCIGCRNVEDTYDKRSLRKIRDDMLYRRIVPKSEDFHMFREIRYDEMKKEAKKSEAPVNNKKPWNYMTSDVMEAVTNCLIAQAIEAESLKVPDAPSPLQYILEEFSRCLQDMLNAAQTCPQTTVPDDTKGISA